MSLFESQIDYEFVGAVKKIGRELQELNKNLKENVEKKAEASAEDSNKNSKTRVENIGSRLPFGNETLRERFKDWKEIPINGNSQFPMIYGDFKINLCREPDSITGQRTYVLVASVGPLEIFAVEVNMETPEETFQRINRIHLIEDAKNSAEEVCEDTYLADILTEKDFKDIINDYLENYDMTIDDRSQLEKSISRQISLKMKPTQDNWKEEPVICHIDPVDKKHLQEFFDEMCGDCIRYARVTDTVFIVDGHDYSEILENNHFARIVSIRFSKIFPNDFGMAGYHPHTIKTYCLRALLDEYTKMCGEDWRKIYPHLNEVLNKCSRKRVCF